MKHLKTCLYCDNYIGGDNSQKAVSKCFMTGKTVGYNNSCKDYKDGNFFIDINDELDNNE